MAFHFYNEAVFDYPLSDVHNYYESPGTVVRLTPDWAATVVKEPTAGFSPGSQTEFVMGPPWAQALSHKNLGARWVAEHTVLQPHERFVDEMRSGPMRSWIHEHEFENTKENKTIVRDKVSYEMPLEFIVRALPERLQALTEQGVNAQLRRMFAYRTEQTEADLEFQDFMREYVSERDQKTFAISGVTGLVGTELSALLRSMGHKVRRLVRKSSGAQEEIVWDPANGFLDANELIGVDIVIHLAGAPIAGRFTEEHKDRVYHSRIDSTRTLVEAMRTVIDQGGPRTLVSASATGWYGRDVENVSEDAEPGDDFLAHVCKDWEREASEAEKFGVRVVRVRTGLVLSARGGILGAQLPLYFAGLGGPLAGGDMWLPWIGIEDLIRTYCFVSLNSAISGPVNAVSPNPVQQKTFARTLGSITRRPSIAPTPKFAPKLLLGEQGAQELALSSCKAIPKVLEKAKYPFRHPMLEQALSHTLGRY
ncbi:TIGR01777 family oxidoreductase [Corynebacterium freiburgense]|uniref:TIGR01777 family oxidoreductase n=1 Tax=Corynebacterium freiburgense TaxID=556548 RepID=UPI00041653DB|nr:TIGR01777 family oxidoreductase [Corynebacterium freiburgense]WJZ02024.1 Epimerase family protein [Corynebacterium freiburgense]